MKFQLERILLFSDAVFAIAITLMIIEIKPPHLEEGITNIDAINAFLYKTPIFVGTILSFYLIGLYWYKHHDLMRHLVAYDSKMVIRNLSLLLSIAFLPFSTAFVFENAHSLSPIPLIVYNLNYTIASLLNYSLYKYCFNPQHNLCIEDVAEELLHVKRQTIYSIFVFIVVSALSLWNTNMAPIAYGLFGFQGLFINRGK